MATDMTARALAVKASKKGSYISYESLNNFPVIGVENQLYFDKKNAALYYWDEESFSYKILVASSSEIVDQKIVEQSVQKYMTTTVFHGGTSEE